MSCSFCEEKNHRFSDHAAGNTYVCRYCNQKWWCYNVSLDLWTTVEDQFTWEAIKRNSRLTVSISDPAEVVEPDKEDRVLPASIAWPETFYPILRYGRDIGLEAENLRDTIFVQYIGEYRNQRFGNILSLQFKFPVMLDLEQTGFGDLAPHDFMVAYLGPAAQWPTDKDRGGIMQSFGDEGSIVYLVSGKRAVKHESGSDIISFVSGVVKISDPNVGIISPIYYYDPSAIDCARSRLKPESATA